MRKTRKHELRDDKGEYLPNVSMDGYERLKKEDMNDWGVQLLVEAIVSRAADDWRFAKMKQKTFGGTPSVVLETERFFRSGWFHLLTGLDGEAVLERLKEEL